MLIELIFIELLSLTKALLLVLYLTYLHRGFIHNQTSGSQMRGQSPRITCKGAKNHVHGAGHIQKKCLPLYRLKARRLENDLFLNMSS